MNTENGLPIKSWYEDKKDIDLFRIYPILEFLSKVDDVRKYIGKFVENNEIIYKNLTKVQADFEKEKEKGMTLINSKSNSNLNKDLLMLKESINGFNSGKSIDSFVLKTPAGKSSVNSNMNGVSTGISKTNFQNLNNNNLNLNNINSINNLLNNNFQNNLNINSGNDITGFKTSIPRSTNNKVSPTFDYSNNKLDAAFQYGSISNNNMNPNTSGNNKNMQNININIINSSINNYVVSMNQKSKTPFSKKDNSSTDDLKVNSGKIITNLF